MIQMESIPAASRLIHRERITADALLTMPAGTRTVVVESEAGELAYEVVTAYANTVFPDCWRSLDNFNTPPASGGKNWMQSTTGSPKPPILVAGADGRPDSAVRVFNDVEGANVSITTQYPGMLGHDFSDWGMDPNGFTAFVCYCRFDDTSNAAGYPQFLADYSAWNSTIPMQFTQRTGNVHPWFWGTPPTPEDEYQVGMETVSEFPGWFRFWQTIANGASGEPQINFFPAPWDPEMGESLAATGQADIDFCFLHGAFPTIDEATQFAKHATVANGAIIGPGEEITAAPDLAHRVNDGERRTFKLDAEQWVSKRLQVYATGSTGFVNFLS